MTTRSAACWIAAALLFAGMAQPAFTQAPPAKPNTASPSAQQKQRAFPRGGKNDAPAANPAEAAPGGEASPPPAKSAEVGEFQPVLHARGAKISTCMDMIVGESASVIDSTHTAISSWARSAPDDNIFVSIVGLNYANKTAPNAAAVMFAAPIGARKCEGTTVQVYPVARSCSAVQASLIKEGHTITTLRAMPVIEMTSGSRDVLIPTAGGGCVLVAVSLR